MNLIKENQKIAEELEALADHYLSAGMFGLFLETFEEAKKYDPVYFEYA